METIIHGQGTQTYTIGGTYVLADFKDLGEVRRFVSAFSQTFSIRPEFRYVADGAFYRVSGMRSWPNTLRFQAGIFVRGWAASHWLCIGSR